MTRHLPDSAGGHAALTATFDIEQVSGACGLSPGLLRMWELRYGWPRPGRHANGYRYFSAYQVAELRRAAELVRSGLTIGKLVVDGMPQWPQPASAQPRSSRLALSATHALPAQSSADACDVRDHLIAALQAQSHGRCWEQMQRCTSFVHPLEQWQASWAPCLVGLEEHRLGGRPWPAAQQLADYIAERIRAQLGAAAPRARPLWLVPLTAGDVPTAWLAALVLSLRGRVARPWQWDALPASARFATVGVLPPAVGTYPVARHISHLRLIGEDGVTGLIHRRDARLTPTG